ncbi:MULTISPECIES: 4Fe-4S binding protein [unclassified Adlercreutzia]|uniref:4Fe-4S binding protein n=1 Tax=unclassified Adlercreutzia TaxID=2636013 RepID=UPI0013EE3D13|nr:MULTISPECIES: 4Fe-4S binding protein [unclassified Adlercreutzia]
MPTINDVMEMAELLRSKSVVAVEDHCVAVRNRNASCHLCADACMADAITVGKNELAIDAGACVACGACVAVCPTAALVSLDPMDEDLAVAVADAVAQTGTGTACVACARMAARQLGDPEKFACVPCLGRVTEPLLVGLAAHGVEDIVLVDGTCATCKYGAVSPAVDETIDAAASLLEAVGAPAVIARASEFPPELLASDALAVRGAARRGFFTQAGGYARNVTMTVAEKAVADALHQDQKQKLHTLRERLGAGKSGKMPTFVPERNMRIMDALCQVGERTGALEAIMRAAEADDAGVPEGVGAAGPVGVADVPAVDAPDAAGPEAAGAAGPVGVAGAASPADAAAPFEPVLSTRHFGALSIDAEKCSGCGMCVMFCPTEALKYSTLEEPADEDMRYLEFQATDCTQCRLCVDVCLRHCIELSREVPVAELFDFEPRLVEIPRPKKPAKLFNRNR